MPIFEYLALDSKGKEMKGKIDAPGTNNAIQQLKTRGLTPIELKKDDSAISDSSKKFTLFEKSIPKSDISAFTRQFATMIDTGIPYNRSLEIIIQEVENKRFQSILSDIRERIVEGSTLASAMQSHPKVFPNMFVSMVQAGETSGNLSKTLMKQAEFQEEQQSLESKVQTAMIYPMIMSLLGLGIVIFMIKFILPKIIPVFQHFNIQLPLPTRIVIAISDAFTNHGLLLLIILAGIIAGIIKLKKNPKVIEHYDRYILKVPVFGDFMTKLLTYRLAQSLGTLLSSGVDIRQALQIAKFVTGNKIFENSIQELAENVTKKGFSLSQGLKKSEILSDSTIQMIRVGEESGKLEMMLLKISENLEKDVKATLEKTVAFLEPIIILSMALGVGFIIMAIMLPIFQMNQLV